MEGSGPGAREGGRKDPEMRISESLCNGHHVNG